MRKLPIYCLGCGLIYLDFCLCFRSAVRCLVMIFGTICIYCCLLSYCYVLKGRAKISNLENINIIFCLFVHRSSFITFYLDFQSIYMKLLCSLIDLVQDPSLHYVLISAILHPFVCVRLQSLHNGCNWFFAVFSGIGDQ